MVLLIVFWVSWGHARTASGICPAITSYLCRPGSTPFRYESPSCTDHQHLMPDFDTRPPTDLGSLPSQIKQIQQIQETLNRETLRIIASNGNSSSRWVQTSWGTRGGGRNLGGPNANLGGRRSMEAGANAQAAKPLHVSRRTGLPHASGRRTERESVGHGTAGPATQDGDDSRLKTLFGHELAEPPAWR